MTAFRISPGEVGAGLPSGRRRAAPRLARWYSRAAIAALSAALLLAALPTAQGQTPACSSGDAPEEAGPTDINAVSGNGGLTAATNSKGTLTVLKWPSPSYYDQLDYRTTGRSAPRMGAEPNDGAFLGLAWRRAGEKADWHFSWLRTWATTQRFAGATKDEIITTHTDRARGLRVQVRDVVVADKDALVRAAQVSRTRRSPARFVRLFSFANFNPVFSKSTSSAEDDWCNDDGTDAGARYLKGPDAVVHSATGVDESTGKPSSVALAMAFSGASEGHSIGTDPASSSYDDSTDAQLSGDATAGGQNDATVFDSLRLDGSRSDSSTVVFAAGPSRNQAIRVLQAIRDRSVKKIRDAKVGWWKRWLSDSPLPADAPRSVVRLARRSLIVLRQAIDDEGLVVTSVATQSPLALDWVRNGSYMNAALLAAHHVPAVEKHNRDYARLQSNLAASTTPRGNWPTSMYADGTRSSSIPYEVDSTGLGIWTLWDLYAKRKDIDYLAAVYESIRRAADYLTSAGSCVDAATGLQCLANEEGHETPTRTIVGAQAVWQGLDSAVSAAKIAMKPINKGGFGHSAAKRDAWTERRNELGDAIRAQLYDGTCTCYTRDPEIGGTLLWPVRLLAPGSKISDGQAAVNWRAIRRAMRGDRKQGGLEARTILGNAHAWAGRDAKTTQLKRALEWLATKRVTKSTGLLGGAWAKRDGRIEILRSQPHAWHHAMFYLAALKTYGKKR